MIGAVAGTTSSSGLAGVRTTTGPASSGSHVETGSDSAIRPSSTSIMTAAATTGLVIEAMRKTESLAMGAGSPTPRVPTAATSTRPPRATRPTAPGTDPSSTNACRTSRSCGSIAPPSLVCRHGEDSRRGADSSVRGRRAPRSAVRGKGRPRAPA